MYVQIRSCSALRWGRRERSLQAIVYCTTRVQSISILLLFPDHSTYLYPQATYKPMLTFEEAQPSIQGDLMDVCKGFDRPSPIQAQV